MDCPKEEMKKEKCIEKKGVQKMLLISCSGNKKSNDIVEQNLQMQRLWELSRSIYSIFSKYTVA